MEKINGNKALNQNGNLLQLRSKEVSEVMGNIPSWIRVWGTLLILFFFVASMLLIANIHCVKGISGTAMLKPVYSASHAIAQQNSFLEVMISAAEHSKVKPNQQVMLSLAVKDNLNNLNKISCSIDDVQIKQDSCVL